MACSKSAQAMPNKFVIAKEIEVTVDDFGTSSRLSDPGKGHNFRKHPDQEEVVIVIAGKVEQWVDREKRILGPGDSAFIPADVVHASFNVGDQAAKIIAILGPCVGPVGYEVVDTAKDPLRK